MVAEPASYGRDGLGQAEGEKAGERAPSLDQRLAQGGAGPAVKQVPAGVEGRVGGAGRRPTGR
jgi:hypothetical protein